MFYKRINHQSITSNWLSAKEITSPKTLVLGSFNPDGGDRVDFYYGRSSNYFWQIIAALKEEESNFFFDKPEGLARKKAIMDNRFCCLDIINHLTLEADDDNIIEEFVRSNIFSNYSDDIIFTSKKGFNDSTITIKRSYNSSIIELLETTVSITRVINTMGKNRIVMDGKRIKTKPLEYGLKENGFSGFIKKIHTICKNRNIEFDFQSISPSDYAVTNKSTDIGELKNWIKSNLHL